MNQARVGPFILRQEVCRQADASLWLAERVGRERRPRWAAVRLPDDSRGPAAERIALEYATLRQLDDPRLPRVLGHFPGVGALAVAWVPGTPIQVAWQAHRRGRLTLQAATVLAIGEELAEVLRHVHAHRDPTGRPLVHGRLAGRHVRITRSGRVALLGVGRPHGAPGLTALSPELLAGGPATPATDRWALGALLVELLGGRRLYSGDDDASRVEVRVDPWVDPIARINPEAGRLLRRLLAADPAARFADDGELIRAMAHARRSLRRVADLRALGEALAALDPGVLETIPAGEASDARAPGLPDPAEAWPAEPRMALGGSAAAAGVAFPLPRPGGPAGGAASDAPDAPGAQRQAEVAAPLPVAPPVPAGRVEPPPPGAPATPTSTGPDIVIEPTEPLGPGHDPAPRAPLRLGATARRLGLGELAALSAMGLLLVTAIYFVLARG